MRGLYKRPGLDKFLKLAFDNFRVSLWTSAGEEYASKVIEEIIPSDKNLDFFWSHEKCTRKKNLDTWEEYWVKDLNKVKKKGYLLDQVLMLDDTPDKLSKNYGNYVRIKEFYGEQDDQELHFLSKYLLELKTVENIRAVEKRGWRRKYA